MPQNMFQGGAMKATFEWRVAVISYVAITYNDVPKVRKATTLMAPLLA